MEQARVVRVIPDVSGIDKHFDYAIPDAWFGDGRADRVTVGALVRIELHGRRIGGWVAERGVSAPVGVELLALRKWSSIGPDAAMIELCRWAAYRWFGHVTRFLKVASPPRNVAAIPPSPNAASPAWDPTALPRWATELFAQPEVVVQRLAPGADRWPIIEAALAGGSPLFIAPTQATVEALVKRIRGRGRPIAKLPDDWALARAGAPTVGTRIAAFSPQLAPTSIVVLDEHDDALTEERSPTWNARDVAVERARRLHIPCVLVSPAPSLYAVSTAPPRTRPRVEEFDGWPQVTVIDRRLDPPGSRGLLSTELTAIVRNNTAVGGNNTAVGGNNTAIVRGGTAVGGNSTAVGGPSPATGGDKNRVACIVNRLGRAQLLICGTCDAITTCEACDAAVIQPSAGSELVCRRCGTTRPVVCQACGATRLKNRRVGVSRAREELEALVGETVGELSGETRTDIDARVVVGTEALLYAFGPGSGIKTVVFLDFDQDLVALRQRASQQALAVAIRAARLVGRRSTGARLVLQTRRPDDPVVNALVRADPSVMTDAALARAEEMGWPPFRAQGAVSGAGAQRFVDQLDGVLGIDVFGPIEDKWLVRANDHDRLLAALNDTERPKERLRVDIDPTSA